MNPTCPHCQKIREELKVTAMCRLCWRIAHVNGKVKKGKRK